MSTGRRTAVRHAGTAVMALVCAAVLVGALLGGTYVASHKLTDALASVTHE